MEKATLVNKKYQKYLLVVIEKKALVDFQLDSAPGGH